MYAYFSKGIHILNTSRTYLKASVML